MPNRSTSYCLPAAVVAIKISAVAHANQWHVFITFFPINKITVQGGRALFRTVLPWRIHCVCKTVHAVDCGRVQMNF